MRFLAVLCAVFFWLVPANHAAASTVYVYETEATLESVHLNWFDDSPGTTPPSGYIPVNPKSLNHSLGLAFGQSYDMEIRITVGDNGEVELVDCGFLPFCGSAPSIPGFNYATYDSFGFSSYDGVGSGVFVNFSAATGGSYTYMSDNFGSFSDDNYDDIFWLGHSVGVAFSPATPVPLPAGALLLGTGLVLLPMIRQRRL